MLALLLIVVVVGCSDSGETSEFVEVAFDGESCSVEPTTVPAGGRGFVLTNDSNEGVSLYVSSMGEGHQLQELIDLQNEAGGSPAFIPKAEWLTYELTSFDPDARPPESELADDQSAEVFDLTEGTDIVYLGPNGPERLWFCGTLEVTAPTS